jgi:hypothetical protein
LSNRLTDFGLRKSLEHLDAVRQTLAAVTDRFAAFEATALKRPRRLSPCFSASRCPSSPATRRFRVSKFTTPAWSA